MLLMAESSVVLRLGDTSSSVSAEVAAHSPSSPSLAPSAMLARLPELSLPCDDAQHLHGHLTSCKNS